MKQRPRRYGAHGKVESKQQHRLATFFLILTMISSDEQSHPYKLYCLLLITVLTVKLLCSVSRQLFAPIVRLKITGVSSPSGSTLHLLGRKFEIVGADRRVLHYLDDEMSPVPAALPAHCALSIRNYFKEDLRATEEVGAPVAADGEHERES